MVARLLIFHISKAGGFQPPNLFYKKVAKKFFGTIERQGLRPRTPWSFAVCGRRPKALPLETASFLKKAGQKLLFLLVELKLKKRQ
ncbi:MAG: hypothetical protein ACI4JM_04960 [Oscillospiraceae bacterium]